MQIDNRTLYIFSFIIFLIGVYGAITNKNLFKILISLSIMETALNIFLVSIGYISGSKSPILFSGMKTISPTNINISDPLPHALVLTAIVIGVGTTAIGVGLAIKLFNHYKTLNINRMGDKDEL
ncbi:MAG: sodium:proton antiporter [candidate division WOR-3 bacterium]